MMFRPSFHAHIDDGYNSLFMETLNVSVTIFFPNQANWRYWAVRKTSRIGQIFPFVSVQNLNNVQLKAAHLAPGQGYVL